MLELRLTSIVGSFCNLRALMASTYNVPAPNTIVTSALSISDELAALQATLPPYFSSYDVTTSGDSDPASPVNYYYTWPSLALALLHTASWMTIIILHSMILQQLQILLKNNLIDPSRYRWDHETQIQQSSTLVLSSISHICASVRYHLSLCSLHPPPNGSQPQAIPCAAAVQRMLKPLFVAGDSSLCPEATRAWILKQLRKIGAEMGMRQASLLAETIIHNKTKTDWLLDDRNIGIKR